MYSRDDAYWPLYRTTTACTIPKLYMDYIGIGFQAISTRFNL